jgi:hypothetical protein
MHRAAARVQALARTVARASLPQVTNDASFVDDLDADKDTHVRSSR